MILVVCAGTATDVGKTWVGAAVLGNLRSREVSAAARKPVQSFSAADSLTDADTRTDADVLAAATGSDPHTVCPAHRWYSVPMAPPMAADVLGVPAPLLADLVSELRWPTPPPAVGWVEAVGGVRSPIADDGDTVDLCNVLRPDLVVLVADAGLGTINAVRTSVSQLDGYPVVVFLNRYSSETDLHQRNRSWLESRCGFDVLVSVVDLAARVIAP